MTIFTAPVVTVVKTTAIITTAAACTAGLLFKAYEAARWATNKVASKVEVTAPKVEIKQAA